MEASIEMYLDQQSRKESQRVVSEMVDSCFNACIYNFRTRKIDPKEKLCLYQCTDKYFRHATKSGRIMTEQQLLMKDAAAASAPSQ